MNYALRYLKDQGRAADVPICRVMQGKEPREFWDAFQGKPVQGRANAHQQYKK